MKRKTIKRDELSSVKMVVRNEKTISRVILDGTVRNWVGYGWLNEGRASKLDYEKHPIVID